MTRSIAKRTDKGSQPLRRAWRDSRGGLAAIFVFSAFINVFKFAMPLYLLQVLDRIPASRSVETLIMLTIVAVFAVLAGVALEAVRRRMLTRWGVWIEHQFGPKLLHDGLTGKVRGRPASVQLTLDDLSTLRTFVSKSAAPWFDIIWAPVFILGVYLVHPLLGTIGLLAVAAVLVLGVFQEILTREPRRASKDASTDAEDIVSSAERNAETVGGLTMATNFTERWRRSFATRLDERERSEVRIASFSAAMKGLGQCLRIGVLSVGIWLVLQNALTIGGIFAARIMVGFGYSLVERAIRNWRALRNVLGAYRRIKARLAIEDIVSPSVQDSAPGAALVLDKITFRYPGQRDQIIRQIELTVEPGELLLVVGPAAAGKTTLSRLFTGVLAPRFGQVRLGNVEICRLPAEMREVIIGYLPQETRLFKGTVRENIARMGVGHFDDIVAAATLANIHDMIVRMPQGYDTEITEEAVGMSGSERKRIALARAICGGPRLVVLDEPEANLDLSSRKALEATIKALKKQGSTVVITTQATRAKRLSKITDKVLILGGSPNAQIVDGAAYSELSSARDVRQNKKRDGAERLRPVT